MAEENLSITPERFWELYAGELNEEGKKPETLKAYRDKTTWTKKVKKIAESAITKMLDLPYFTEHSDIKVDSEYFRIDVIGYTTKWNKQETKDRQHDWELKIAYEHENDDKSWHDELCKLCHIVADLRVIHSYHDLKKKNEIEKLLQNKVKRLRMRMKRVPNSSWLFIFGPLCKPFDSPFEAFTVDSELNVVNITGDKEIIPADWKK